MLLPSGQDGLLVELKDGSHAVLVPGTGKRAIVVKETSKGKRTELSLSSLKNGEEVAELAAGKGRGEAASGTEVMSQVIIVLKDENMARQYVPGIPQGCFTDNGCSVQLVTNCTFHYVLGVFGFYLSRVACFAVNKCLLVVLWRARLQSEQRSPVVSRRGKRAYLRWC